MLCTILLLALMADPTRDAPPDEPALRQAEQKLRASVRKELSLARKPGEKAALARKVVDGVASAKTPAARMAALQYARELAAEAGDGETWLRSVEEMASRFEVPADYLLQTVREAADTARSPSAAKAVAEAAMQKVNDAAADQRFDEAMNFGRAAFEAAGKAHDNKLVDEVRTRAKVVVALRDEWKAVSDSLPKLQATPDDPALNLLCGRYLALTRGEWAKALPMLAKGADADLKAAAEKDLADPKEAPGQLEAGNVWWELAQKRPDEKRGLNERAAYWYRKAQGELSGIEKSRITYRLAEIKGFAKAGAAEQAEKAAVAEVSRPGKGFQAPAGQWVDLMPLVQTAKDTVAGSWRLREGRLEASAEKGSPRLAVPIVPDGNYDLQTNFVQASDESMLGVIVPVAGKQCMVALNYQRRFNGIDTINGKSVSDNPSTTPGALNAGRPYLLEVSVRISGEEASITATLDGRPWIFYRGALAQLGMGEQWRMPRPSIGLAAQGNTAFNSLKLRRHSGEVKSVR